jgi:hypothetical protein
LFSLAKEAVMKRIVVSSLLIMCLVLMGFASVATEANKNLLLAQKATPGPGEIGREAQEHPRIAAAIHELEEAIRYMEAAPHDFGGHKAKAIQASRAAIRQLRQALAYRAERE